MDEKEAHRRHKIIIDQIDIRKQVIEKAVLDFRNHITTLFGAIFAALIFIRFNSSEVGQLLSSSKYISFFYTLSMISIALIILLGLVSFYLHWLIEHSSLMSKETMNDLDKYSRGESSEIKFIAPKWQIKLDIWFTHILFWISIMSIISLLILSLFLVFEN